MEWTMRDERFKSALFRFVDVLPSLNSPRETLEHLREYFGSLNGHLAPVLKPFLKAGGALPWLASPVVRHNVTAMANRFIAGRDAHAALPTLRKRGKRGIRFTVDILGEAAVSESEAEEYAARYLRLIEALAKAIPDPNVSIKISALYSQIHPAAPERAVEQLKNRLRPLLRRAQELGVFINFDMESYALKALTVDLFKSLVEEPEFRSFGRLGVVIQAYLRDSERDLDDFIRWAAANPGQFTVRLVKGAYWDYERIVARQKNWPVPVFESKAETDANYERLTRKLLENASVVCAAFGTHNVRSIAHAMVCAEQLGVESSRFEFQMLYGMSEPIASALLEFGYIVREYAPVGELIPGMGYLVRRLLENTSNEGFLRAAFAANASPEELLRDPNRSCGAFTKGLAAGTLRRSAATPERFCNEPPMDFTIAENRERMRAALTAVRAQFGKTYPLLIGGKHVETSERMPSLNPAAPDEIVGYVARASVSDAEHALDAARRAFPEWRNRSAGDRAAILENAADILREQRFEFAALEIIEAGKPWIEADGDIAEAIDFCNYYASEMRRLGAPQITEDVPGEIDFQHYIPRGVGVVISPWNFPVAILCGMTAAALVTGNCAIMKPAEQTSVLAFRLAEIFLRAGVPPGALALLTGVGEEIGEFLINDPRVDFVAFTGSKEVGLKIYEATGRHFAKAVCEMGGKNAIIVDSDADLDEAVAGVIASAFNYSGQKCSACSRLIVLAENYDRFLARLVDATRSLKVSPPENPETIIGPLIDDAAWRRVRDYIEIGKREAKLALAGSSSNKPQIQQMESGYFVPPVIFTDVPPSARIAREEIFGPVLSLFKAATFDEALALANDSDFALTAGLYSRSPAHIERAKNELVAGNVYINRPTTGALVQRHPFGGFKMSGTGTKAGGRDYLKHFLLPRVVSENVMRRGFAPEE